MRRLGALFVLLAAPALAPARAHSQNLPSSSSSSSSSSVPSPAPTPTPQPSIALPSELDRVLRDYEKAWGARDAAGLAALFSEDGFVMQGSRPAVRGRAAIRAAYEGHGGPLFLRAFAYSVSGDVGFILGGYSGASGAPDDGKFTLTLRKGADGRWLIFSDMDNGNRPPKKQP